MSKKKKKKSWKESQRKRQLKQQRALEARRIKRETSKKPRQWPKGKILGATCLIFLIFGAYWVWQLTLHSADQEEQLPVDVTIYIRADGSIDPSTASILNVGNNCYTLTANIFDPIVIERDNIVIDGTNFTIQGTGDTDSRGINLVGRSNVTITNIKIREFDFGILLNSTSNSILHQNDLINNYVGIYLEFSSNNTVSGNNIPANDGDGIGFNNSHNNTVTRNRIEGNTHDGVILLNSSNNIFSGNDVISNNEYGIELYESSNNNYYHNNIIDNDAQVYSLDSTNFWNTEYPFDGNFWSNYTGFDLDHDGIGDSTHIINEDNTDNFPLTGPFQSFNTTLGEYVNVISNSTIESFHYFESNITIRINISNTTVNQIFGFCRITIPKILMDPPHMIIIDDGSTTVLHFNNAIYNNDSHRWIYFAYERSEHQIEIVPEL